VAEELKGYFLTASSSSTGSSGDGAAAEREGELVEVVAVSAGECVVDGVGEDVEGVVG
jgi:hypothetical protein